MNRNLKSMTPRLVDYRCCGVPHEMQGLNFPLGDCPEAGRRELASFDFGVLGSRI